MVTAAAAQLVEGDWRPHVGGRKLDGEETFEVHCPADGTRVAVAAAAGVPQVDAAISAATQAFETSGWAAVQPRQRSRLLHRIADALEQRVGEFARVDALCTGRPIRELGPQVGRLPEWFRYFAGLIEGSEGAVLPFSGGYLNYTERLPLGVVAQIVTWNHPLLLLAKKLAPALATGNCVVVKPSELTPLTAIALAETCEAAGLPPGVLNVVPGFGAAGSALVSDGRIAKADFTGGTETGRAIAVAAAQNLVPSTLELGGKTPMIVFADIGLERAVAGALFAGYVATGQTCVSGARMLVQRSLYEPFVELLAERSATLRLGHPLDPATEIGPLVSARQRDRVLEYIRAGRDEGARLVAGGAAPELPAPLDAGAFVAPTVFADVEPHMRIWREEIFGPVISVTPFDDEQQAVELANTSDFGLGASVWTAELGRAHRVARGLRSGVVWINDHHRNDPSSPWGGFRSSGHGRENGWESILSYTAPRSTVVNLSDDVFDWFERSSEPKRYG
jgi:acyl-CoA reductase-like NAD-dependent aldehyde dehydrogenase